MNIALCTDENFVIPCLTCITSILEHNRNEVCGIYVLTEGITETSSNKFCRLSAIYNTPIHVVTIDVNEYKSLKVVEPFPMSMYFRFSLPEILKTEEKALYLDCDIIIRHSIKDMYDTDLTDKACGVIIDQHCDDPVSYSRTGTKCDYFNSGVLLMNLDYWRKYNIARQLTDYIAENPDKCVYPDQDALNVILEDKVVYLSPTYNYQHFWTTDVSWSKMSKARLDEVLRFQKDPVIVHFSHKDKPWHSNCRNIYRSEFDKYNSLHPFIGRKLHHPKLKRLFYRAFNRLGIEFFRIRDGFRS